MEQNQICKKCGGHAEPSKALLNTMIYFDDFGGDAGQAGSTGSRQGEAKLQNCLKCTKCGHSWIPNDLSLLKEDKNYIKAQVHLVATSQYTSVIRKRGDNGKLELQAKPGLYLPESFHLYFTTDEEIKDDDWFFHPDSSLTGGQYELLQCNKTDNNFIYYGKAVAIHKNLKVRNIVATTNPDLWKREDKKFVTKTGSQIRYEYSPTGVHKIPTSFFTPFITAYNAGCPITEVLLERYVNKGYGVSISAEVGKLKVRSDGTVIVKEVKEKMYTRAELFEGIIYGLLTVSNGPNEAWSVEEVKKEYPNSFQELCTNWKPWFDKNYPQ